MPGNIVPCASNASDSELPLEHQELTGRDSPPPLQPEIRQAQPARALDPEDVQALFFEIAPQACLIIGSVDAFDDLAPRSPKPAAKFHAVMQSGARSQRNALCLLTLSAAV